MDKRTHTGKVKGFSGLCVIPLMKAADIDHRHHGVVDVDQLIKHLRFPHTTARERRAHGNAFVRKRAGQLGGKAHVVLLPFHAEGLARALGDKFHRHARLICFRHGKSAERHGALLCVYPENGNAEIRRKRVLLVQDVLHLPGDAADLPVNVHRHVVDGLAQVPVIVVQPLQAGKQADDAIKQHARAQSACEDGFFLLFGRRRFLLRRFLRSFLSGLLLPERFFPQGGSVARDDLLHHAQLSLRQRSVRTGVICSGSFLLRAGVFHAEQRAHGHAEQAAHRNKLFDLGQRAVALPL